MPSLSTKGPLALVKERFNDKAGLVAAVKELAQGDLWIDRVDEDKGLDSVSNAKLLRLHDVLSGVKSEFGSRAKLIASIMESDKRKDEGYRTRLERLSTPRLMDELRAARNRAKPVTKKAKKQVTQAAKATKAVAPAKSVKAIRSAKAKSARQSKA